MEVIGIAIGVIIGYLILVVYPMFKRKEEEVQTKSYLQFQQELEIEKEKNQEYFRQMRERQERFHRELRQCSEYAEISIKLVTSQYNQLDRDEWEEWVLLENAACMPISMGKALKPQSNDKKEST